MEKCLNEMTAGFILIYYDLNRYNLYIDNGIFFLYSKTLHAFNWEF